MDFLLQTAYIAFIVHSLNGKDDFLLNIIICKYQETNKQKFVANRNCLKVSKWSRGKSNTLLLSKFSFPLAFFPRPKVLSQIHKLNLSVKISACTSK